MTFRRCSPASRLCGQSEHPWWAASLPPLGPLPAAQHPAPKSSWRGPLSDRQCGQSGHRTPSAPRLEGLRRRLHRWQLSHQGGQCGPRSSKLSEHLYLRRLRGRLPVAKAASLVRLERLTALASPHAADGLPSTPLQREELLLRWPLCKVSRRKSAQCRSRAWLRWGGHHSARLALWFALDCPPLCQRIAWQLNSLPDFTALLFIARLMNLVHCAQMHIEAHTDLAPSIEANSGCVQETTWRLRSLVLLRSPRGQLLVQQVARQPMHARSSDIKLHRLCQCQKFCRQQVPSTGSKILVLAAAVCVCRQAHLMESEHILVIWQPQPQPFGVHTTAPQIELGLLCALFPSGPGTAPLTGRSQRWKLWIVLRRMAVHRRNIEKEDERRE